MSRRVVGVTLVGASVLLGVQPSHSADPPAPQLPMATCDARINDGPGDGIPSFDPNVQPLPGPSDPRGNVGGLDIRGITFRVTETRVYAFMTLADIPATLRETDSAYGYVMWFKRNGKFVRFDQVYANSTHAAQGLAPTTGYPTASTGTSTTGGPALTGLGGGIDKAKKVAYVYADRAAVEEKTGGAFVAGEELTDISGRTELWETKGDAAPGLAGLSRRPADKAEDIAADKAVWKVGNDGCFAASTITLTAADAQFGDPAAMTATLKDDAGAALADRKVTLTIQGESQPRALTTDAAGAVRVELPAAPPAGTYTLRVTYAGDDFSGAGTGTSTFTVRAETIRMAKLAVKTSGTSRIVTATLTEDDPQAFARAPVAWYVNGKKVATVNTDSSGRSVFKSAKAGQKVQARYAGATGRYTAVNSNIATV